MPLKPRPRPAPLVDPTSEPIFHIHLPLRHAQLLFLEADRIGCISTDLARSLLMRVLEDDLVKAVLDEG